MPDWLAISGDSITTGEHGATDFVYAEDSPVPNTGQSNIVFEEGTGIGGLSWVVYNNYPNGTVDIGSDPRLEFDHDGSADPDAKFASALNENGVGHTHFRVEFRDVTFTNNSAHDNWSVGVSTAEQSRAFNSSDGFHIRYHLHEADSQGTRVDHLSIAANSSLADRVELSSYPSWGSANDITIEYDGEARLYINGSLVASSTAAQDASYAVAGELEDDGDVLDPETATIGTVDVDEL